MVGDKSRQERLLIKFKGKVMKNNEWEGAMATKMRPCSRYLVSLTLLCTHIVLYQTALQNIKLAPRDEPLK